MNFSPDARNMAPHEEQHFALEKAWKLIKQAWKERRNWLGVSGVQMKHHFAQFLIQTNFSRWQWF